MRLNVVIPAISWRESNHLAEIAAQACSCNHLFHKTNLSIQDLIFRFLLSSTFCSTFLTAFPAVLLFLYFHIHQTRQAYQLNIF